MKSMTGFGVSRKSSREVEIEITVRAVNGRFLETRTHMPREYLPFESEIKKRLQKKFNRGTVDIFVVRRSKGIANVELRPEAAKAWLKAYQELAKTLKLKFDPRLETLASLPEVMGVDNSHHVSTSEKQMLLQIFDQAMNACLKERTREGVALQKDLVKCLKNLHDLCEKMQQLASKLSEEQIGRIQDRLSKLKIEIESSRVAQEAAILADRGDINEEIVRLSEHVSNCLKEATKGTVEGKKLDFYSQELLREVNTIGSKSQMADLTQVVIQAKSVIEKIKEQVQNLE